jgi:hypothetical protein
VDKAIQAVFVQASMDLIWLAEHGKLDHAAQRLAAMRYMTECLERSQEPADLGVSYAAGVD